MKKIFLTFILLSSAFLVFAQTPKIALVKPNGTTTIHATFDAAYSAATDNDYIYLPGGTFNPPGQLDKKLHIYGAGSNQDSSAITGKTILTSLQLYDGASGGTIEGVSIISNLYIAQEIDGYTISNCHLNSCIYFDNLMTNSVIKNNSIGTCQIYSAYLSFYRHQSNTTGNILNSLLSNNVIMGQLNLGDYLEVNNNLFFQTSINLCTNSTFNNNIFLDGSSSSNSTFNNNVNVSIQPSNVYNNNIVESFPDIFINPGTQPYTYNVHNDYHVKSTSQCHNSGTDGTDRGMYGGTFPWVEGMVPSNPHIYYKNVAPQTNASGQLQIHFRVRTGN
ncbi:MAG: hypothetical protein IPL20_00220 [Saprospiraceae bacterium]|nr:hypothetical protein [Saprospiraceae bacterium]